MAFNNFGCTKTDVLNHFVTGCNTASAVESQLGGEDIINGVIANVANELSAHICPDILNKITVVDFEQLNPEGGLRSATNTVTLGLSPVASVESVWNFSDRPATPPDSANDLTSDEYSVAITGGVATITRTNGFSENSYVYASYTLDTDSTDFSIPSLASIVCLGAVSRLGPKIYSDEAEWKYLETLRKMYQDNLNMIADCDYKLPELAVLKWWQPLNSGGITSIPFFRS